MNLVLITTSGTGSRLNNFTKNNNKSLIPVGDKYAICHIIDIYPNDTEFVITLGHYGKNVKDFLDLAYPDKKIQYVDVDCFEGPGSSLGYSMLQAKNYLSKPFIFHCCDTIINKIDMKTIDKSDNILFVCKNEDYKSYSSINVKNEYVSNMNDKGFQNNDYIYTGLCFIKDYEVFWKYLEELYNEDKQFISLSDIHSIRKMLLNQYRFKYIMINSYFDTGNLNSYLNTCLNFKSKYHILVKENESLCFLDNRVIKFIDNSEINQKRYLRGLDLSPYTPKLLGYRDNYIVMEFIEGEILSNCKRYGEILKLLEWAQSNLWINKSIENSYKDTCVNFYKNKTLDRLEKLFLKNEFNNVNNIETGSIFDLINKIDFNELSTSLFSKFHGDFILDNIILKKDGTYCLLDWRHEFGSELNKGDIYYDLAKLKHNIIFNHFNIINNMYDISYKQNTVYVDLKCNYLLIKQLEDYNYFINKYNYDLKKIDIITSLIWLNMSPLYQNELSNFLFYFGKFNLYLALTNFYHNYPEDVSHPIIH